MTAKLADLQDRPHYVYVVRSPGGWVRYVGCTVNPKIRAKEHRLCGNYQHGDTFEIDSEHPRMAPAREREAELIRELEPLNNHHGNPRHNRRKSSWQVLAHEFGPRYARKISEGLNTDDLLFAILDGVGDALWIEDENARLWLTDYYLKDCKLSPFAESERAAS